MLIVYIQGCDKGCSVVVVFFTEQLAAMIISNAECNVSPLITVFDDCKELPFRLE